MLAKKVQSMLYPKQELELNYLTTKGNMYREEDDWYLLYRFHQYRLNADDVYELIKKDITEFPIRMPQCQCNTLFGLIGKEVEQDQQEEAEAKRGHAGKGVLQTQYECERKHRGWKGTRTRRH
ncbi:hypothetical protein DFH11DRAFT_1548692 [Phellopilus nigrolimitatus]|nr:hypothetical protein DFH11DRAFT_1548692 [Phellopilus nigrolimitatus]